MTLPRQCTELAESVLAQGASARKMSLALKHVAYSGDLMRQLKDHSTKLENIYDKCHDLITSAKTSEATFEKQVNEIKVLFLWFEKAEVGAWKNCSTKRFTKVLRPSVLLLNSRTDTKTLVSPARC